MLRLETEQVYNQISQKFVSVRDLAVDTEVGSNGDGSDNKMVKKSPLSKKPNVSIGYPTSIYSNADSILFEKR